MLAPNDIYEIPAMTAAVARAAFPKGNAVMKIRDELGSLFEDVDFAAEDTDMLNRDCYPNAKYRKKLSSGLYSFPLHLHPEIYPKPVVKGNQELLNV